MSELNIVIMLWYTCLWISLFLYSSKVCMYAVRVAWVIMSMYPWDARLIAGTYLLSNSLSYITSKYQRETSVEFWNFFNDGRVYFLKLGCELCFVFNSSCEICNSQAWQWQVQCIYEFFAYEIDKILTRFFK